MKLKTSPRGAPPRARTRRASSKPASGRRTMRARAPPQSAGERRKIRWGAF